MGSKNIINKKIGSKTEYKIKVSPEKVETLILEFIEKTELDILIHNKFNRLYDKLDISYDDIKNNSRLRSKKNYKLQFDYKLYDELYKFIYDELKYNIPIYLEQYKNDNNKDYDDLKIVLDNIFIDIGLTMFQEKLNKISLITFHYLLKFLEVKAIEYSEKLNLKNIRGYRIPLEIFRYELVNILSNTKDLTMFMITLKSLIEQILIKYNRRTKIGQFYYNILMTTPELLIEKILRFMMFTSIKNKNPMTLRTIFSTYVTLIHMNINSHYSTKLSKTKVGHFSQLNNLFEENGNKQLTRFHNIEQMITICRAKNYLNRNKRFYKENYDLLKDQDINTYLDINYQDFITGYRIKINLLDYYYMYNKILKNTKNGFNDLNSIKIKTKYIKVKTEMNLTKYITEMVKSKFFERFMNITNDEETVNNICDNMVHSIINELFPKGFLNKDLKLTIRSYDRYIDDIQRLLSGFDKIFKGENKQNGFESD